MVGSGLVNNICMKIFSIFIRGLKPSVSDSEEIQGQRQASKEKNLKQVGFCCLSKHTCSGVGYHLLCTVILVLRFL